MVQNNQDKLHFHFKSFALCLYSYLGYPIRLAIELFMALDDYCCVAMHCNMSRIFGINYHQADRLPNCTIPN